MRPNSKLLLTSACQEQLTMFRCFPVFSNQFISVADVRHEFKNADVRFLCCRCMAIYSIHQYESGSNHVPIGKKYNLMQITFFLIIIKICEEKIYFFQKLRVLAVKVLGVSLCLSSAAFFEGPKVILGMKIFVTKIADLFLMVLIIIKPISFH